MNPDLLGATVVGALSMLGESSGEGTTAFSQLSKEAQDLIVSAAIGEFDESNPPEMSQAVREEIENWIKHG
jgi:aspartate/methionine/tyrosine aminotransferase